MTKGLHSEEVSDILERDIKPALENIRAELEQIERMLEEGFETGGSLDNASVELKTYRGIADSLQEMLEVADKMQQNLSDSKNNMYTEETGKIPGIGIGEKNYE